MKTIYYSTINDKMYYDNFNANTDVTQTDNETIDVYTHVYYNDFWFSLIFLLIQILIPRYDMFIKKLRMSSSL